MLRGSSGSRGEEAPVCGPRNPCLPTPLPRNDKDIKARSAAGLAGCVFLNLLSSCASTMTRWPFPRVGNPRFLISRLITILRPCYLETA